MNFVRQLTSLRVWLVEGLYGYYFVLLTRCCSKTAEYVLVDIDNTVNTQATRLSRFVVDGRCDYRKANRFVEIMSDVPVAQATACVNELAGRFALVWFTSRSIRQLFVTYIWLVRHGFPTRAVVFTGSTLRKIRFLQLFLPAHSLQFVIDDMREGYEFGKPQYVLPYRHYLEANNITVLQELPRADPQIE